MTAITLEFGNTDSINQLRREEKILAIEEFMNKAYFLMFDIQDGNGWGKKGNLDPRIIDCMNEMTRLTDDFEIVDTRLETITPIETEVQP
jgi:hypothetical protein